VSSGGQAGWYSPEDQWPRHPKPWWRIALKQARSAGWLLKPTGDSAHTWGKVYCRHPSEGSYCSQKIFSSGDGGESVARDLERLINRCVHLSSGKAAIFGRAVVKMGKIESLIKAAGRLLDAAESSEAAADLWGKAEELIEDAENDSIEIASLMERAEHADLETFVATGEARSQLTTLGMPADSELTDLVANAERTAVEVRVDVETLPRANEDVSSLTERLEAARAQLTELRRRLSFT
jgi:hypothetical protein